MFTDFGPLTPTQFSKVSVHVNGYSVTGCMRCVFFVWKHSTVNEVIWYTLSFLEQSPLNLMGLLLLNFSVAMSVSHNVSFISFNFAFCASKIMHL